MSPVPARDLGRLLARRERVGDGAAAVEVARPLDELARADHESAL